MKLRVTPFGGGLAAAFVLIAAIAVVVSKTSVGEDCFQYDKTIDSAKICGTPEQVDLEQRNRGYKTASDAKQLYVDPIDVCLQRAEAQSKLFDWPDRYRDAFERGCREYIPHP